MRAPISYKIEFYRVVVPTRLSFFEKEKIEVAIFGFERVFDFKTPASKPYELSFDSFIESKSSHKLRLFGRFKTFFVVSSQWEFPHHTLPKIWVCSER
ncbi:hypothetical protein QMM87_11265 [Leptospira santarosai]|uniref:hypothetical protein n=2 Tax=Leptospira santarosai TaxID=28183 RepID=UPI0024AF8053|nr:hypothetical protein [Leptospira santarosai]MDI7207920.1 hypothetical protein [Leptospira santarosai]MDI7229245.1 hypothetical protein [Leptospira santarosai]